MENQQNKSKFLTIIISSVVLILIVIGFFVSKDFNKSVDSQDEENISNSTSTSDLLSATSSEIVATTSEITNVKDPIINENINTKPNTGVQVINGDGFQATIRPVSGEAPIINSFVLSKKDGNTCRFSWDVSKAEKCDFVDVLNKTAVKDVGEIGGIQTSDASEYQLKCYGSGGKSATSEVLSC